MQFRASQEQPHNLDDTILMYFHACAEVVAYSCQHSASSLYYYDEYLNYFREEHSLTTSESTGLSERTVEEANKFVSKTLERKGEAAGCKRKATQHSDETRAKLGKYAAVHGVAAAQRHLDISRKSSVTCQRVPSGSTKLCIYEKSSPCMIRETTLARLPL